MSARSSYRIFETKRFEKDLNHVVGGALPKLREKLDDYVYPQLKKEPHLGLNIRRLKEWDPPTWRYRIGDWRFFYEVDDEDRIVYMIAAEHRSRAYR